MNVKLPEIKEGLADFEKTAGISVDVIARVEGHKNLSIARYIHGTEEWQINGFHGFYNVVEWWPLPEIGTGESQCQ
jgi:hypothetical protein